MLKLLRNVGFTLGSREARTRRRRVERRLRAESLRARRRPSPDLYRRTLAALNDATLEAPPAPARWSAGPAYALALLVVLGLGAFAVRLGIPGTADDLRPPEAAPTVTGFDMTRFDALLRQRLDELENTWEAPLRTEAMLLAQDARSAGKYVLASLPLPAAWQAVSSAP